MPYFDSPDARLYYEEVGEGMPLLLIAPGGMKSAIGFWRAMPWNPLEELADRCRVIAMDQRNAGKSHAPVRSDHGWHTYAADQLALLNHLGVDRFHVMGMCIGGPYAMGLIDAAPERVASAVIFQSIGLMQNEANRDVFYEMFDGWADGLKADSGLSDEGWLSFRSNMYDGENFLFNLGDDFVRNCTTPLCVLEGNDVYHPRETSQRLGALAQNVTYIERWKEDAERGPAMAEVSAFLAAHSLT